MVRICMMVSGGGTNLQALLDAKREGRIPFGEFALVIASNSKAYALERAAQNGIPALPISRKALGDRYSETLINTLREHRIDCVVLAGFLTILDEAVIRAYPDRILNIHPSLLPAFGGIGYYGLKVHIAVLERGVKVTGATVHFVNEIPDGGRIVAQKAVDVLPGDTPEVLQRRVMEQAEWQLLPQAVADLTAKLEWEATKA